MPRPAPAGVALQPCPGPKGAGLGLPLPLSARPGCGAASCERRHGSLWAQTAWRVPSCRLCRNSCGLPALRGAASGSPSRTRRRWSRPSCSLGGCVACAQCLAVLEARLLRARTLLLQLCALSTSVSASAAAAHRFASRTQSPLEQHSGAMALGAGQQRLTQGLRGGRHGPVLCVSKKTIKGCGAARVSGPGSEP